MKSRKNRETPPPAIVAGKPLRNFICLVDSDKPPHLRRRSAGRYRVGAKNADQARRLLQAAIGFGSVTVYYEDNTDELSNLVAQGQCVREIINKKTGRYDHVPARHMSEPVQDKED